MIIAHLNSRMNNKNLYKKIFTLAYHGLWLQNETTADSKQTIPETLITMEATGQRDHEQIEGRYTKITLMRET